MNKIAWVNNTAVPYSPVRLGAYIRAKMKPCTANTANMPNAVATVGTIGPLRCLREQQPNAARIASRRQDRLPWELNPRPPAV